MIHVHQLELKFGVVSDSKRSVCKSCVCRFTENERLSISVSYWQESVCCYGRNNDSCCCAYAIAIYALCEEAFTNIEIINQATFDTLDLWVPKSGVIWLFLGPNGCTEQRSADVQRLVWNPRSTQLPLLSEDGFFLQPRPDRLPHLSSCPPTRDGPAVPRAAPRRSSGTKTANWAPTCRYSLSCHPCLSILGVRTDCGRITDLGWTNIWRVFRQKLLLLFLLLLLGSSSPWLVYFSTLWWTEGAFVVDARHMCANIFARWLFFLIEKRQNKTF